MSTSDQALATLIQYALLEPPDGGAGWPSGLWTRDEVFAILSQRQDRLLFESQLLVTPTTLAVVATQHRIALPADWIRTISLVWVGDDGTTRELPRSDSFEADHLIQTWESTDTPYPLVYLEVEAPHLEVQIAPAPSGNGTLHLLYVRTGTELTGNGVDLVVPDELAHAVKYGALADLLSKDGRGRRPDLAAYAEQRFGLAVEATRLMLLGWA